MKKKKLQIAGRTRRLTLTAMLCTLSVAVMYLCTLLDVLELTGVAIAAVFMLLTVRELGRAHSLMLYVATALLSLLLLPRPDAGVMYALFGGLYPLIKFPIERRRRSWPLLIKLLYINVIITAIELLTVYVFLLPFEGWGILLLLYAIANPTFFLFDHLLNRLLILYEARLRPRIARYLSK